MWVFFIRKALLISKTKVNISEGGRVVGKQRKLADSSMLHNSFYKGLDSV